VTVQSATLKPRRAVLRWTADDPYVEGASTSGVDNYDLLVRKGQGPWQLVLDHTDRTSYTLTGKRGARFSYRVRARDDAPKPNTSAWTQPRGVVLP
jgi:hypothetical protein